MSALIATMLLAAVVSLLLLGASGRRLAALPLLGELVMLLAMLDTHLPHTGLAPPLLWSALLAGCALATALVDRLRRRAPQSERGFAGARVPRAALGRAGAPAPHADRLHAVGMLLAAGFIAAGAAGAAAAGGAHGHGGVGLLPPLLVALAAYAVAAVLGIRRVRAGRVERLRRAASAVALLAMGGMAIG